MKRFLCHTLGGAALALSFSLSAPVWAQETFAYPNDFPPRTLQSIDYDGGTLNDVLTTSVITVNTFHKSRSVADNAVTLNSGAPERVYGALNFGDTEGLSGNSVVINGGTVDIALIGADHTLDNGNTSVTNNLVEINGGMMDVFISGGEAASRVSGDALASGNTVVISGGTFGTLIRGGYAYSDNGQSEARDNTVRIGPGLPASTFAPGVNLQGGAARTATGIAVSTGNTLQIESAGLRVVWLDAFQRFEFTLPAGLASGDTVLTVTGMMALGTDAVMTVNEAPGFNVSPGDAFTLIGCAGCGTFSGTVAAASQSGTIGGYPYALAMERNAVVLRILPRQSAAAAAAPIPVASGGVFAALGLLLAGLAAVGLRRRRCD